MARKNSKNFLAGAFLVLPKCANASPWQGTCHSNSSPGRPVVEKDLFSTQGILAGPCPVPRYPAKRGHKEKMQWLSIFLLEKVLANLELILDVNENLNYSIKYQMMS